MPLPLLSTLHNLWETTLTSSLQNKKMYTFDGHVSDFGNSHPDFNNGNNTRQFSVTSLLRLGHKRRSSDVDSSSVEGESVFFSLFLVCLERGMRKFKAWVIFNRRMSVWSLICSMDQSLGVFYVISWMTIRSFLGLFVIWKQIRLHRW